jgi:putative aldouronate transport system permease protein
MGFNSINFMQEPGYFRIIYISANLWQGIGWGSIIYLSALTSIDESLYESAMIDGASRLKQAVHITLPSLSGMIMIMLILQIGNLMSVGFDMVYLLQQPTTYSVSEVLSTYIYKIGITGANYSVATVAGLFNSFVSLVLVFGANYFSKKYAEISIM